MAVRLVGTGFSHVWRHDYVDWTRISFPSSFFSSPVHTHTDDPLISLYIFFVAVRGVGLVRWFFALFFRVKRKKAHLRFGTIRPYTHCGTYQIVIDPADSSLFVSSSSFFSLFFFSLPQLLRSSWVWGIQFSFSRLPFAHPFFLFLADRWTAAFGPRWVGLGRLPGHVWRGCLSSCFDYWIVLFFLRTTRTRESSLLKWIFFFDILFRFLLYFLLFVESLVLLSGQTWIVYSQDR